MKQATAKLNYLKISPRKVRLVATALKGLSVKEAEAQLMMRPQRSAGDLLKLLRSAVANAKNQQLEPEKMLISEIRVDKGPMLRRTLPRAMGRASLLQKKMSHVILVIAEAEEKQKDRFNIVITKKDKKRESAAAKPKVSKKKATKDKFVKKEGEVDGDVKQIKSSKSKSEVKTAKTSAEVRQGGVLKRFFRRKSV